MTLKYNPLTWFVRKQAWRWGIDVCTFPNVAALLNECDLVIDAGASDGDSRDWFRLLGYRGRIVSFEPVPEVYEKLIQRLDDKWERHPYCLSDVERDVEFHVRSGNHQTSGIQPSDEPGEIVRLRTQRLDSLLSKEAAKTILLKVDCEGHDLAVVRGAKNLLPRVRTILMEVATVPRYEGEPDFAEVTAEMKKLGFRVSCCLGNQFAGDNRRSGALEMIFEPIL